VLCQAEHVAGAGGADADEDWDVSGRVDGELDDTATFLAGEVGVAAGGAQDGDGVDARGDEARDEVPEGGFVDGAVFVVVDGGEREGAQSGE
jgi:hypothetical protein